MLGEYGRNLGLAFQIVDDMLDLTAAKTSWASRWPATCARARPRWLSSTRWSAAPGRPRGDPHGAGRTQLHQRLAPGDSGDPGAARFHRLRHGHRLRLREAARLSIADLPHSEAKRALLWSPASSPAEIDRHAVRLSAAEAAYSWSSASSTSMAPVSVGCRSSSAGCSLPALPSTST